MMPKMWKVVWLVAACVLLNSCAPPVSKTETPAARLGQLDLHAWSFESDGMVPLNGEWEFYWQELASPSSLQNNEARFAQVPAVWTEYQEDGKSLPAEGYATFRLMTQLPADSPIYALFIEGEGSAYAVWVDGKLLTQNGRVADKPEGTVPQTQPKTIFFQRNTEATEIVVQIANFNHRKAGFRNPILLGLPSQIHDYQRNAMARDSFIMGIYLVMGLYHLFIYTFRPVNRSTLFFAICCFVIFIRKGLLDQKLLTILLPDMPWDDALRVEYATFFLSPPVIGLYLHSLYPKQINRWFIRSVVVIGLGFTFYMFMVNTLTLTYSTTPYQVIILAEIAYLIVVFTGMLLRRSEDSTYIALASFILFAGVILEILYLQNIVHFRVDGTATFLGFIFVQAVLLSSRLSKSYQRVKVLSGELEEANLSLLESEIKYRTIFEDTKDMIFIADLDQVILDVNPVGEDLLGYEWTEMVGMKMTELFDPADYERIMESLGRSDFSSDLELQIRKKDGSHFDALVTLSPRRDENRNITGVQGHIHDLSARKQAEVEKVRALRFEQLSITDPLTHIYNRRFFDEVAAKEWERAKRKGSPLSVIIFDIDHFKQVNDAHGHLVGDKVLINLARVCQANLRNMDVFARFGGEEFVVLMTDTGPHSAFETMERLRESIADAPLAAIRQHEVYVTISAGISGLIRESSSTIHELLDQADKALYHSKKTGRNRTSIWNDL